MTQRNYNNITTTGQLTGGVSTSATSLVVSGLTNAPAAPFTITVDRNTAAEEICLVTAVVGSTLTVTRGFDSTAAQAHAAGATIEHTAVALDFSEANAHVNATTNVHGRTGSLVDTASAQTVTAKTFSGNTHQADVSLGDAVVAKVPTAAGVRNMFRGIGADGNDKFVVDNNGNVTGAGVSLTSLNSTVSGHTTSIGTINTALGGKADKTYVDLQDTATLNSAKSYADTQLVSAKAYTDSKTGGVSPALNQGFYFYGQTNLAQATDYVMVPATTVNALNSTFFTISSGTVTAVKAGFYSIMAQFTAPYNARTAVVRCSVVVGGAATNDGISNEFGHANIYGGKGSVTWTGYLAAGATFYGVLTSYSDDGVTGHPSTAYSLSAQLIGTAL